MKKIIKFFITLILIITSFVINFKEVYANNITTELTPEYYTNSDFLIGYEGDSNHTIKKFSEYVNSLSKEIEVLDLDKVIPENNLYSTQLNSVFYHMGKEYGYYLVKDGDFFDLLLVDFKNENFNNSNNQYLIRIEQLLQVSFERILVITVLF